MRPWIKPVCLGVKKILFGPMILSEFYVSTWLEFLSIKK